MILIAVFEGICAKFAFDKKSNTNVENCTKKYLNKKYNDRTAFLTCQDKEAMKSFIDNVFHTGVNFEYLIMKKKRLIHKLTLLSENDIMQIK